MSAILNLIVSDHTKAKANIVALHCSMGSGRQWSGLFETCGSDFNPVAFDLLGYGKSPPCEKPTPGFLDMEARHLHRELDTLVGPIHLVGHSFGGAVAFKLATTPRYARRIRSLTLIEPVLPSALLEDASDEPMYDIFALEAARICAALWAGDKPLGLQRFLTFWNGPGCYASLSDARKASLIERIYKLTADFSAIFGATGVATAARQLSMPTLLFSGGRSPAPVQQIVNRLAFAIAAAQHVHLPDAGHMLAMTHAEEINPQILQHIRSARPVPAVVVPLVPKSVDATARLAARRLTTSRSEF